MVKFILHLFIFTQLICSAHAQYQMRFPNSYYLPENWPRYDLQFSHPGTLKDIYDAGIRPFYRPHTENSSRVEFKHARVRVQQSNGEYLPEIQVDYGQIVILTKGLSDMSLISQPLTLEDARSQILPWLPVLRKTEAQLDDYLAKVNADYSGFDDPDFGAAPDQFEMMWYDNIGVGYSFSLPKGWNEQTPVRMQLHLSWHRLWKGRDQMPSLDPISIPKGYENEPIQVRTKGFGPDDMAEMRYAKGLPPGGANRGLGGPGNDLIEMNEDGSPGKHVQGVPAPQTPKQPEKKRESIIQNEKRNVYSVWIGLAAAVLLGIGWTAWIRSKKRRN